MRAEHLTPDERAIVAEAFDAAFYLARNPDVEEAGMDPLEHFLDIGWRETRDPTRRFSIAAYLDLNDDIARAEINPFVHYLLHGRAEGRATRLDLGFRYDLLRHAPTLEARLETGRPHDIPGGPLEDLAAAVAGLGPHLFITVSHDAYVDHVGGVQLCLKREARAIAADGWSHLHLYPAVPSSVADFETLDPVMGIVVGGEKKGLFEASHIAAALRALQGAKRLKTVSFAVHSFLGHSIPAVSAALAGAGAKTGFLWLHDQASLCASYALLRNDVEFCGAPPPDSAACSICVYGLRRRVQMADHADFFAAFDITVLAPSQAQMDLWTSSSNYRFAAAHVHPHAVLAASGAAAASADAALTVAFLGFPAQHKGWPIFTALAERFADDPRYAFLHLGKQDDDPPPIPFLAVEPQGDEPTGPVELPGETRNSMVEAARAAGVDVALILSICPETFCFTAHEAAAAGAAVIALPDSGAVARFASDPAHGRVVADETELNRLFESGEILSMSRVARRPDLFDLRFSRMSADFLSPPGKKTS